MDLAEAIKTLYRVGSFGMGCTPLPSQEMLSEIEKVEAQFQQSGSHELELALGGAFHIYVSLHVRGNARKHFLEKAVNHLEKAYLLAAGKRWHVLSHIRTEPQLFIGASLGSLLVTEAQVRNLEKGIAYLERFYKASKEYEPTLCTYVDALYTRGDYHEAARIACELHDRAENDPLWKNSPPPGPLRRAAKALRAEAKCLKKEGKHQEAVKVLRRLVETGHATANDQKLLGRLAD